MLDKFFIALVMGLNSGLSYALLGSTMTAYLNDVKVPLAIIGLLTLRTLPYSLKPLWAPVVDNTKISSIGHRKGWMIASQCLLFGMIISLGFIDAAHSLVLFSIMATITAFFAATYDMAMEAYRIEFFKNEALSKGTSFVVLGFRAGLVISGACGLYLSSLFEWKWVFVFIALMILPCMAVVYLAKEPNRRITRPDSYQLIDLFKNSFIEPLKVLIKLPKFHLIFLLIAFYKVSDAYLDAMLMPFLKDIGFSKTEIATFTNAVTVVASILGTFIGAHLINKFNSIKVLLYGEIFASITNLLFIFLAIVGNSNQLLFVISFVESFGSGISNVILISFMSSLCHKNHTATHYAILGSMSGLTRVIISSSSGLVAAKLGWILFFVISALLSIPSLICLCILYQLPILKLLKRRR